MKKITKNQLFFRLSVIILVAVFSVAAYNNVKSKSGKHEKPPKQNSGPIQFQTRLSNRYYYDNNQVYLYIDLKAKETYGGALKERTPLNIAVVIDKSGSMDEMNKLGYVKKAVEYIIDQLHSDDYISIVTYDTDVNVLVKSQRVRDKYDLKDKVSRLHADGWTNLSGGMFEGYDQVNNSYRRGYVNRVLLLSDGLANKGVTDRWRLADMVRDRNRSDGITISTFGVGNDFDENLMSSVADYGKGNYYYIRNSSDIPEIFASELRGIENLVGQGTKVKVRFDDNYLSLNKVYGYPYDISGDEVTVDFKDIFSAQTKSVLVKFDVKRKIDHKLDFESELTYDDVTSDFAHIRESQFASLEPVYSMQEFEKGNDETVQQSVSVFEANEMMENAFKEADNGNYDKAREQVQSGTTYMNQQMQSMPTSPEMQRQLDIMGKYNEELRSAESKSEDEKKEMQKSGKYDNYNSRKKNQ